MFASASRRARRDPARLRCLERSRPDGDGPRVPLWRWEFDSPRLLRKHTSSFDGRYIGCNPLDEGSIPSELSVDGAYSPHPFSQSRPYLLAGQGTSALNRETRVRIPLGTPRVARRVRACSPARCRSAYPGPAVPLSRDHRLSLSRRRRALGFDPGCLRSTRSWETVWTALVLVDARRKPPKFAAQVRFLAGAPQGGTGPHGAHNPVLAGSTPAPATATAHGERRLS
jgi:hypothetical protein